MTTLSLIVAVADNGAIGKDNDLPWRIPGDLKYFKATTMGKPLVMGRKTFDSLGRPLPGRPNLVVSRNPAFRAEGTEVFSSLDDALRRAGELAGQGDGEIMLIGGAQLFEQALPSAGRLYLTEVHCTPDADVFFPPFDRSQWRESSRASVPAEGKTPAHDFVVLERKN